MASRHEEDIMTTRFATAAAAASITIGLSLVACGSSAHPATSSTGPAQDASGRAETEAIVQCYRAHGIPNFPDPVYDPSDGRWHFAVSPGTAPESAQHACQHLFPSGTASPPVPQAQFQALVRLAECIRQHGMPSWPDPNPQGQFRLSPQLSPKSPAGRAALKACQRYIPSGGLDVVAAS
jgi:hypothetical protein